MTIATRVGISELRRKHYQNVSLDRASGAEDMRIEIADESATAGDAESRTEVLQTLQQLIENELTDKQRFAVRAALDGLPVEEIAERTGSNRNAVYKLVHDARLRLRAEFEKAGITVNDVAAIFA